MQHNEALQIIASADSELHQHYNKHPHSQEGGPFGMQDRKLTGIVFEAISLMSPESKTAIVEAFAKVHGIVMKINAGS
jgi:hypothetical protein